MKTESTVLRTMNSLISCDLCKKICKELYKSGDLRVTEFLAAGVNGTSSIVSSVGRSTEASTRGSSISDSTSSSSTTTDSVSDLTALYGSGSGSNSATTSDQEHQSRQGREALDLCPSLQPSLLQALLENC